MNYKKNNKMNKVSKDNLNSYLIKYYHKIQHIVNLKMDNKLKYKKNLN